MGWSLEGLCMEICSCRSFCVCNLGAADLPDGWHSGACVWDIQQGNSDGVDLSGTTAAMTYDMSGDFLSDNGRGRIYVGDSADPEQHRELEAILSGQRGGVFEFFGTSIPNMLPARSVSVSLVGGDQPAATVGDVAKMALRRHKTTSGKQTTLNDAEYLEAFGVTCEELGDASGSRWADPELREWNGGAGGFATFKLSA